MKTISELKGSKDIEIGDYIEKIKTSRKQRVIDEEFAEDSVLEIVNHKRRWKKTYNKRIQRLAKQQQMGNGELRLN